MSRKIKTERDKLPAKKATADASSDVATAAQMVMEELGDEWTEIEQKVRHAWGRLAETPDFQEKSVALGMLVPQNTLLINLAEMLMRGQDPWGSDKGPKYEEFYRNLVESSHAFRAQVAASLQPMLNANIKTRPQEHYDDKQHLASWVNAQLRDLGLAIKCPKTGRPGILVADLKGSESEISRFRLEVRGEDGKRSRTTSWRSLPDLDLMEDESRQEPLLDWAARERKKKDDSKKHKGR